MCSSDLGRASRRVTRAAVEVSGLGAGRAQGKAGMRPMANSQVGVLLRRLLRLFTQVFGWVS